VTTFIERPPLYLVGLTVWVISYQFTDLAEPLVELNEIWHVGSPSGHVCAKEILPHSLYGFQYSISFVISDLLLWVLVRHSPAKLQLGVSMELLDKCPYVAVCMVL